MTETASPPARPQETRTPTQKTGVDKAQSWITLVSTSAGVIGAVGTGAVWLIANLYTGTLEVKPDQPIDNVVVKVYDSRGKESTFHSKSLQLMPGTYHLEVVLPDGRAKHVDATIKFGETSSIPIVVKDKAPGDVEPANDEVTRDESPKKKKWFQFWRKSTPDSEPSKSVPRG